ncbi:hypothetical protein HK104_003906 [Borealophlyctis nickersoniae]|nr:hypothetical protein HK104_003906 [Borealophlyctis nickersoniae]
MSDPFETKKRKSNGEGDPERPANAGKAKEKSKKRVRIGNSEVLGGFGDEYNQASDILYPSGEFSRNSGERHSGGEEDTEDLETAKARRGAVKLDGYGSESDTDDEDGDVEMGGTSGGGDDDMFGDSFDAPEAQKKKGKKDPNFMKRDEITGQEFGEFDEYDEGGVKIMAFNMDEELEEGNFDESGHFVRKKDVHQMHDNWLQGVSRTDIEKAKAAHERQEARADAEEALAQREGQGDDANNIWLTALQYMQPGETVYAAMKRWGGNKKSQPKWKKNKKNAAKEEEPEEAPEVVAQRKKAVEELTGLSDKLMSFGQFSFQDLTYEQVVRNLRVAEILGDDWQPGDPVPAPKTASNSTDRSLWEYKWGKDSEELFGPFPGEDMKAWDEQGYFDQGELWVRKVTQGTPLDASTGFTPKVGISFTNEQPKSGL